MYHCFLLIGFLITTGNAGPQEPLRSEACPCEPRLEIRVELNNVAAATVSDPFAFDDNIAPYLALREKHPDEFSVQEMYQDAVFRFGIEGHLKALVEEYRNLDLKHPGDPTYHYLFLRSLAGRDTAGAIRGLSDMLVENASFAPAHRTLAGIYGSPAFRDLGKQKSEQEKFLALCPGSTLASRYRPAPDPSPKLEQAERLLAGDGDCDRIIALTIEALKEDEWRNQRIRAVDWYSVDYKRQNLRELREEYWKAWSIQVHALRKAGRL
ncbi:MAG TPA: hypothetical protein VJX67_11730, partial [Blastocatellia bacterium]|nr:hypothetical protein [Blastocatellia bacterium]